MQFTSPPESTTAITDFILGCLAFFFLCMIRSFRAEDPLKVRVWSWIFGLLAAASVFGAAVHGIVMDRELLVALWMPLAFLLGMMVSVFVIGVMYDWKGAAVLKKAAGTMISLGIAFFAVMFVLSKSVPNFFIIFIAYSGAAMLFSLGVYVYLAAARRDAAPALMAAGIAAVIAGSALQAAGTISFSLVWEFDYNSVYHFLVMGAAALFYCGIRKSLN